jgi:hypothetical protein
MSLCESHCEFVGYNNETKNSKCECNLKNEISFSNIKIDKDILYDKFVNVSSLNIDIIKCYYLLFKKEYIIKNIGSYIMLFIIIIFIVGIFIFWFKDYDLLNKKINIIVSIIEKEVIPFNLITNSKIIRNRNKKNKIKKIKKNKKKKNSFK